MPRYVELKPGTKIVHLGGRPPKVVIVLLALCIGLFVLYAFAEGPAWVVTTLAASGATTLAKLQVYQPFTALLVHLDARGLLFNMLALWIFGSPLSRWWGPRRFLLFWLVTGVCGLWGGVLAGLLAPAVPLHGAGGTTLAMMVAAAAIFPNHMVFLFGLIPLKSKVFSLGLAAFLLVGNLVGGTYLEAVVELSGLAVGLLFIYPPLQLLRRRRTRRLKTKLDVLQGGKRDEPHYWN